MLDIEPLVGNILGEMNQSVHGILFIMLPE